MKNKAELLNTGSSATAEATIVSFCDVNLDKRRIVFNQSIDETIVECMMIPLLEMDNDGSGEPIEIILCTDGGSVEDGMVLCDIIDNLQTPTTITCLTKAYSMGMYILMAGFKNPHVHKRCYKHTLGLLHAGVFEAVESLPSVLDVATFFCVKNEATVKDYVLTHSRISDDEYNLQWRREWYLTADELLKYGIVDEIIGVGN
jgi:ATP-dependent Clp protease protease subunit